MTELETKLKTHQWNSNHSSTGWFTRPELDRLMKNHSNTAEATSLWEQYCPWSDTNGGYIAWIKK